jgi:ABC-type Fe3+-hydroxamate transport system substrate-binding protein
MSGGYLKLPVWLVVVVLAWHPPLPSRAVELTRAVPPEIAVGVPFEVVLTLAGEGPTAVGVVEQLPPGCRLADGSVGDLPGRIDARHNRLGLILLGAQTVRYRLIAEAAPPAEFKGIYVDLLARRADADDPKERFRPIGPGPLDAALLPQAPGPLHAAKHRPAALPGDDGDGRLTRREVADLVVDYLLGDGDRPLDTVCDAAYVYTHWQGVPKTVRDMKGRRLTFHRPVERIITTNPDNSRTVIALGLGELIVGTDECTIGSCICQREGSRKPDPKAAPNCWAGVCAGRLEEIVQTSTRKTVNHELMAGLRPDVIFETTFWATRSDEMGRKVGAPVVVAGGDFDIQSWFDQIETVAAVLDRTDRARALIDFCEAKIERVAALTRQVPEEEKPRVYFAPRGARKGFHDPKEGRDFTRTYQHYDPLELAGGRNVAKAVVGENVNVSIEQIIAWNPEVIFVACSTPADKGVDFLLASPELASIEAIRKAQVYNVMYPHCRGRPIPRNIVNLVLFAKLLHPDRFADLDLEREGNEVYRAFLGVEEGFSEYARYLEFPLDYFGNRSGRR